jgi:hypothetical protein
MSQVQTLQRVSLSCFIPIPQGTIDSFLILNVMQSATEGISSEMRPHLLDRALHSDHWSEIIRGFPQSHKQMLEYLHRGYCNNQYSYCHTISVTAFQHQRQCPPNSRQNVRSTTDCTKLRTANRRGHPMESPWHQISPKSCLTVQFRHDKGQCLPKQASIATSSPCQSHGTLPWLGPQALACDDALWAFSIHNVVLTFPQRCSPGFLSSAMWLRVAVYVLPDVSRQRYLQNQGFKDLQRPSTLEAEGNMFLRNVGKHVPSDKESQGWNPRGTDIKFTCLIL